MRYLISLLFLVVFAIPSQAQTYPPDSVRPVIMLRGESAVDSQYLIVSMPYLGRPGQFVSANLDFLKNRGWFDGGGGSSDFDSNRPIVNIPQIGDNIGGSTVQDFLESFYFAPPSLSSFILGGGFVEVGTVNSMTFRTLLSNPSTTSFTNYTASEQSKGTVATYADGSQANRTDDFGFTFAPIQNPVGGLNVYDGYLYRFTASLDYSGSGGSGTVSGPNATVRAGYPILYGMVADTATAFADPYGELNKLVQNTGNKTVSYTGTGLIFYGFPQDWADTNLSSIIDPNGFDVTASFTRVTYPVVSSTGLTNNYTAVPYVFYFLNTGTTTTNNSNYTFNL